MAGFRVECVKVNLGFGFRVLGFARVWGLGVFGFVRDLPSGCRLGPGFLVPKDENLSRISSGNGKSSQGSLP